MTDYKEYQTEPEAYVLVAVPEYGSTLSCEDSLRELEELTMTAGASVAGRIIQERSSPDRAVCRRR